MLRGCVKFFLVIALFLTMKQINRFGEKIFINHMFAAVKLPSMSQNENNNESNLNNFTVQGFPDNFIFGVSSSAVQTEGGWNEDGKSPSTWDTFYHQHPESILDGSNADISTDSYHRFLEDIEALNRIGHYRFSISWTRILPNGSAINQAGIAYYHKIIDELLARKIEPIVTIFHFDLPQWLQDLGGVTNPIFVDYFTAYSGVIFEAFGSKVKRWITINEPYNYCVLSYGLGVWPPGIRSPGMGDYLCGHHLLIAHSRAYHLYQQQYFDKFRGQISIALDGPYYFPVNDKVTDANQVRAMKYRWGWFADPIYSINGGYPQVMVDDISKSSIEEGRLISRMPQMSDDLRKSIQGTSDFFAFNYYGSLLFEIDKTNTSLTAEPSWSKDSKILESADPSWKKADVADFYNVPEGLRSLLNWIKSEYKNPSIFVTESGWSDNGELEDDARIEYFNSHLAVISKAIAEDECNMIGYTVWSLLDSFELIFGYTAKYGLHFVNQTSPTKERIPKKSTAYWHEFLKRRTVI